MDAVNDKLKAVAIALAKGEKTETLTFVPAAKIDLRCAVPVYYEHRFRDQFNEAMKQPRFAGLRRHLLAI